MAKPTTPESGSLIDRFNRRREQVAAEAHGDQTDEQQLASEELGEMDVADGEEALSDSELLEKYELPDPETVEDEAGLDRFFEGDMPERLRRLALRRVWRLNPLFRFADEMVEYGEDYTDAATVVEGMQTAYQVGKGYLTKAKEALEGDTADGNEAESDNAAQSRDKDDRGDKEEGEASKGESDNTEQDEAGGEPARDAAERDYVQTSSEGKAGDAPHNQPVNTAGSEENNVGASRKLSQSITHDMQRQESLINADDRGPGNAEVVETHAENTKKQNLRPKKMVFRKPA
tara:strand:- start:121 stop:987 length:867 start_codon:yes stop_codon:yes gene_type:complete